LIQLPWSLVWTALPFCGVLPSPPLNNLLFLAEVDRRVRRLSLQEPPSLAPLKGEVYRAAPRSPARQGPSWKTLGQGFLVLGMMLGAWAFLTALVYSHGTLLRSPWAALDVFTRTCNYTLSQRTYDRRVL
jgi:hypothetical protein